MRAKLLFWLKKDGHKNEIFHQPGQIRPGDILQMSGRSQLLRKIQIQIQMKSQGGRRSEERKVSRFTSVRLSPFFFLCCRFKTWDKLKE